MIHFDQMSTETRNKNTMNLDQMTSLEIVTVMNQEDAQVPQAIQPVLPQIAQAVDWVVQSFQANGRLFYLGAGTSGRLGVLDASECPPTFGVSADMVIGLMAGGDAAFRKAVEGAEDSPALGKQDLIDHRLQAQDVVIGVAASGRTPYAMGALEYARDMGCHTIAIVCNQHSAMAAMAELAIEIVPGPEILTGSTRLKAGTAQKLVLNMISTASMVGMGKCYQNLMVDVVQSNEKLNARAEHIVTEATGVSAATARQKIDEAGGSVKVAITMILADCNREQAELRLAKHQGRIRQAIQA